MMYNNFHFECYKHTVHMGFCIELVVEVAALVHIVQLNYIYLDLCS